jgi:hypothetical protein
MLQNTEQNIPTVNYSDLIPGKFYLIQHSREGPQSQAHNTRFRGKFLRNEIGQRLGDPNGILGLPQNLQVSVFENVEIISKNKGRLTEDVWVFSTNPTNQQIRAKYLGSYMIDDFVDDGEQLILPSPTTATQRILQDIRNNNGEIGFEVRQWTFAESSKELEKAMKQNILYHLGNDGPNPQDTREKQLRQITQQMVFQDGGPGHDIADYAGIDFPFPKRDTSGTKRKADEIEIGGRKRRTRRNRRNRRGKTRKGKSRKGKTRRGRHHYRK